MANNVFGNPITDDTLKGMPEYVGKKITKRDRAQVALLLKNAESKDVYAKRYVEQLKEKWGTGVSTLCLIYNATGDPIKYAGSHDWWGHIGPGPYPSEIANGQWGGFLHVKRAIFPDGSNAGVSYRGKNEMGKVCDWMVAWDNPWNKVSQDNKVYTEVREENHFHKGACAWPIVNDIMKRMGKTVYHQDIWNGCVSTASIGDDTSPILETVFTLVLPECG